MAKEPWPAVLRGQMQRVADVGYRITVAAEPECKRKATAFGISLDFIEAYKADDRQSVAALLKLSDYPQIAAVAAGSPAGQAGLRTGDDLLAIDWKDARTLGATSSPDTLLADKLEETLMERPLGSAVDLTLRREGSVRHVMITPSRGCSARVVIKTGMGITAFSDGSNIAVSSKLIEFAGNDDELALIIGHELGHIINNDGAARGLKQRRWMEDQADAQGIKLVQCAGYDVERSLQFWLRRDAQDWLRLLRDPTHRSRKKRVKLMRAEAAVVRCPISR